MRSDIGSERVKQGLQGSPCLTCVLNSHLKSNKYTNIKNLCIKLVRKTIIILGYMVNRILKENNKHCVQITDVVTHFGVSLIIHLVSRYNLKATGVFRECATVKIFNCMGHSCEFPSFFVCV